MRDDKEDLLSDFPWNIWGADSSRLQEERSSHLESDSAPDSGRRGNCGRVRNVRFWKSGSDGYNNRAFDRAALLQLELSVRRKNRIRGQSDDPGPGNRTGRIQRAVDPGNLCRISAGGRSSHFGQKRKNQRKETAILSISLSGIYRVSDCGSREVSSVRTFLSGKHVQAGFTVEMSVIAPMFMFIVLLAVFAVFYEHDKNVVSSAAYETAVAGSNMIRKKEPVSEETLNALFRERAGRKCILVRSPELTVGISKHEVTATGSASFKYMRFTVTRKSPVTEPEEYIRKKRRWKL